jgi:hypothetical protein
MTPRYLLLSFLFCLITITIAIPVPNGEHGTKSVGQQLGQVGLWVFGGLAMIGWAIGSVTYGTNWWHRFKTIQAEHEGSMTIWDATQAQKEQDHRKHVEALDIILDVTRNYTENVGKKRIEYNPFVIAKDVEAEAQDTQTTVDKQQ